MLRLIAILIIASMFASCGNNMTFQAVSDGHILTGQYFAPDSFNSGDTVIVKRNSLSNRVSIYRSLPYRVVDQLDYSGCMYDYAGSQLYKVCYTEVVVR